MNEKILNISAKGVMIAIIVIGVILSWVVISYGNPQAYDDDDIYRMGKEVAITEGKNKEYDQAKLDAFIEETGTKMKQELSETQDNNVFKAITFTQIVIYIAIGLIVVALVFGVVSDPKKALLGLGGALVVFLLVYIVWQTSTDVLPEKLEAKNADLIKEGKEAIYDGSGMKLAGGAITSTIILITIAIAAWIGSAVYKVVKS
jgi:uncharacterized membrane protein